MFSLQTSPQFVIVTVAGNNQLKPNIKMEQVENLTTKNEAAVMPSYFKSLNTSESHLLASWQYLEDLIRKDEALKIITETYRKRLAIGKRFADEYKPMSPGITISAVMEMGMARSSPTS